MKFFVMKIVKCPTPGQPFEMPPWWGDLTPVKSLGGGMSGFE